VRWTFLVRLVDLTDHFLRDGFAFELLFEAFLGLRRRAKILLLRLDHLVLLRRHENWRRFHRRWRGGGLLAHFRPRRSVRRQPEQFQHLAPAVVRLC
jgi:hypothetical protein